MKILTTAPSHLTNRTRYTAFLNRNPYCTYYTLWRISSKAAAGSSTISGFLRQIKFQVREGWKTSATAVCRRTVWSELAYSDVVVFGHSGRRQGIQLVCRGYWLKVIADHRLLVQSVDCKCWSDVYPCRCGNDPENGNRERDVPSEKHRPLRRRICFRASIWGTLLQVPGEWS